MQTFGKSVASIEVADGDKFGENGGFTAILSTPSLDRDGDRLHRDEWVEPLDDRYPLDIDHGMSVADTVGSFHPYFDGDTLMMDAFFASTPKAQEVRTLVSEGHIRSVSVAFMSDKSKKDGEPRRELLNAGIVATPSNRDAVILASKAADALSDALSEVPEGDALDAVKSAVLAALSAKELVVEKAAGGDGALVQAIHDASSHLGASCQTSEVVDVTDPNTGASDGANKSADSEQEVKAASCECWDGYERVPGTKPCAPGSCRKCDEQQKSVQYADASASLAGLDAIIDEAVELTLDVPRESLPPEVGQALDLLVGAQQAVRALMDMMNVYDPSAYERSLSIEAFSKALDEVLPESPAEAAAASPVEPAPAVDAADAKARKRSRSLGLLQMVAASKLT